jgi:hypothetical protein
MFGLDLMSLLVGVALGYFLLGSVISLVLGIFAPKAAA